MHPIAKRAVEAVASSFLVSEDDILGRSRERLYTVPRFALYKILHDLGYGAAAVGRMIGRDHGTIGHGVREANYLLDANEWFAIKFDEAKDIIMNSETAQVQRMRQVIAKARGE